MVPVWFTHTVYLIRHKYIFISWRTQKIICCVSVFHCRSLRKDLYRTCLVPVDIPTVLYLWCKHYNEQGIALSHSLFMSLSWISFSYFLTSFLFPFFAIIQMCIFISIISRYWCITVSSSVIVLHALVRVRTPYSRSQWPRGLRRRPSSLGR
jgi:hypothetical protein